MENIVPHITYVVASVRSSVLVVVAKVAQWWVLQALPQCVNDESRQLLPSLRLAGEGSRNGNHFFHLHINISDRPNFLNQTCTKPTVISRSLIGFPVDLATSNSVWRSLTLVLSPMLLRSDTMPLAITFGSP